MLLKKIYTEDIHSWLAAGTETTLLGNPLPYPAGLTWFYCKPSVPTDTLITTTCVGMVTKHKRQTMKREIDPALLYLGNNRIEFKVLS